MPARLPQRDRKRDCIRGCLRAGTSIGQFLSLLYENTVGEGLCARPKTSTCMATWVVTLRFPGGHIHRAIAALLSLPYAPTVNTLPADNHFPPFKSLPFSDGYINEANIQKRRRMHPGWMHPSSFLYVKLITCAVSQNS